MRFVEKRILEDTYWYSFNDEPIATVGSLIVPRLSDPSFLLPDESPDGLWHLFAHTWLGVEHYTSTSGLEWKKEHLVFLRGHSPFIYKEGNVYYMLYELHDRVYGHKKDRARSSRILLSSSSDLALWSEPRVLLDSSSISRSSYRGGPERISRPQLIPWQGRYRLYFGAGEGLVYDTDQKCTARLMFAESYDIDGPYVPSDTVLMEADPESRYRSLSPGAVRIIPCADGIAAIECAYFYDKEHDRSRSAMVLMVSDDGLVFPEPHVMQLSPLDGWASRCITCCDARYKENEETWYCYYSANGIDANSRIPYVKESLGLLLGRLR